MQYKVPAQKADEFCRHYPIQEKKENRVSTISFVGAILAACLVMNPLTKKIESGAGKMTLGVVAGILAAVGSNFLAVSAMAPKRQKFLNAYGATPYEKQTNTIADIISK